MALHKESRDDEVEFRALTKKEEHILVALLGVTFPGRDALVAQAINVAGRRIDSNGSLEFAPIGGPPAEVVRRVPVEAEVDDQDGVIIHVLLHILNGRLNELEIFREDSGPLMTELSPDRFRLLVL